MKGKGGKDVLHDLENAREGREVQREAPLLERVPGGDEMSGTDRKDSIMHFSMMQ